MKKLESIQIGFMVYGLVMASGMVFVFVPRETMVQIGNRFHLPPFEITPVFEYMARGLSFTAFLGGLLMFYLAFHLAEELRLIRLIGWTALAALPVIVWVHLASNTPLWWFGGDLLGILLLWVLCHLAVQRRKPDQQDSNKSRPPG